MAPKRSLEYVAQITAMVTTAGCVLASLFVFVKLRSLSDGEKRLISRISDGLGQNELKLKTEATAGLAMTTSAVAVVVGIISLIGRICYTRNQLTDQRLYSSLYILYSVICLLGFCAAGGLGTFTAMEWSDIIDRLSDKNEIENLRNSVAATAACSFFTALIFGALKVIVLCCCVFDRYY